MRKPNLPRNLMRDGNQPDAAKSAPPSVNEVPPAKPRPQVRETNSATAEGSSWRARGYFSAPNAVRAFKSRVPVRSELDLRRREVRVAKLRSFSWLFAGGAMALALIGGLVYAVFFSALFALDAAQIVVTKGSEKVSAAQVQNVLRPWAGTPLPRLRTGSLESSLAEIPMVKTATITRSWPAGLEVELDLRTPVFSVRQADKWLVFDTEGVQIDTVSSPAEGTLPAEVTTSESTRQQPALLLMARVRAQLDAELLQEVALIRSDGALLELVLQSGAVVKWGDASETPFKLKVLKVLLGQVPAKLYDVSVPATPVTA